MAKIAKYNGKVIKVGNKLGLHPSCCCGGGEVGCCPYLFNNVPYTIEFNCNGNIVNVNGTLFFGNSTVFTGPNRHNLQIVCTTISPPCDPFNLITGYYITAYRDINCYVVGVVDYGFDPNNFTNDTCIPPQNPAGQVFTISSCAGVGVGAGITATISF